MRKNYNSDVQLIQRIIKNQIKIVDAIRFHNCDFSSTNRGLCNNVMCFDLCALYMSQIGEQLKLLTDSSRLTLSTVIDIKMLVHFRNIIDHDYEKINRPLLSSYIELMVSKQVSSAVALRCKYCLENRTNS